MSDFGSKTANPAIPSADQRLQSTGRPQGRSPVMLQRWQHLLFLHWSVDAAIIQATLPPGLFVDTFEERAYLGVVPFFMSGVRPRFCPPVPGLSDFLELNLRTYVFDENGNPGVWFYSLDANQWLAVKIAQTLFSLPYVYATMSGEREKDGLVTLKSARKNHLNQFFQYQQREPLPVSSVGSLQFFLAERYLLFSHNKRSGKLFTGRVYHSPYALFSAKLKSYSTDLFGLNGFNTPKIKPEHVMFSPAVDVEIFNMQSG